MNSSTSGSGPEPKPQLQPVQAPERELLDEQVCKPGFDPVPRSEPESQTTSVAGPSGAGQEMELQGLCQDSEAGPRVGAGPFTQTTPEQLPLGSTAGTVPRSGPKPQALQRQGQAKTSAGSPGPGIGLPMVSPPLDSYKGWLLKWTNYLKGYQRRWFVLGNGLLSYYRRKHIPALNLSEMPVMASGNTKESSFSKNLQGVSVGISRQLCHEDTVDTVGKLSIFFLLYQSSNMLIDHVAMQVLRVTWLMLTELAQVLLIETVLLELQAELTT
ncbi:Oxysterol-binding protein 2 [Cricetulus griseus]|uniref:Oxysterol-binding protein 2 n=1 Tax=Cricetulus griseus TaxID=10029 RepID=G3I161_CRIGR|nr:Oxysterol-binding protein 2 [Cricetulus griseus]